MSEREQTATLTDPGAGEFSGHSILYVEDEPLIAAEGEAQLEALGFARVDTAHTEEEARALMRRHRYDAGLIDINLRGGGTGFAVAEQLHDQRASIIFCTGYSNLDGLASQFAAATLTKPINWVVFRRILARLLAGPLN